MKKKWLLNNITLKITALLLAILTWLYVRGEIKSQIETETKTITGLEVKILGSVSPLRERQWQVRIEPARIDLKITGPYSRINKVRPENILVFVDLSNLKVGGEYPLPLNVNLPPGIEAELNVNTCKVSLKNETR